MTDARAGPARGGEPVRLVRLQTQEFGGAGLCALIGGGRTAPDRAAFYNSSLIRYLDFNDSYLARGETCHPSDNLGAVLAAAEYAGRDGRDLLAALAAAYQVQCRLSDAAPVRAKGFDHATHGAYAVAAGVARALGLDRERTANAIAISGTALNALRVTRTGALSHWKGLAAPQTAFGATHATFLASRGVTGPREVFEGTKGFMDAIAGRFEIDWAGEDLERVTLRDGRLVATEQRDYEGFLSRPMRWVSCVDKFQRLTSDRIDAELRTDIVESVANLESWRVADLMRLLARVPASSPADRKGVHA